MKGSYRVIAVLITLSALFTLFMTSVLADSSDSTPSGDNEESGAITLNWVDPVGNTVRTETLAPGQSADADGINASIYDTEAMTATVVTGWYWDLDGEGSEYSEEPISQYTEEDALRIGGGSVTVYPKTETVTLSEGMDYVAYYTDGEVTRLSDVNTEHFSDINNLSLSVPVFPSGTVLKLVSDKDVLYLKRNTSYVIDGISLKVDLNGRTVARVTSAAYTNGVFRLGEGGSIEITSSVPGARVFLANNRSKATENIMYGTDGIVEVKPKVDSASVRLSDFEFNGGTMVKVNGNHAENTMPEYANDIPITVDVERVVVNAPLRSSYAVFSTLAPDVFINVTDSEFYVSHGTYAVFHDYVNNASENKYYQSETHATMKGCKVISVTEADTPSMAKLWFAMGAQSSFYVEDTEIIGKLADSKGAIKGSFTFGPGVVVATDKFDYFQSSKVGYGENVINMQNLSGLDYDLTLSFTRSGLVGDYSLYDSESYTVADSCFTDSVNITRSYNISFVSFVEDDMPDFIGSVEWLDDRGVHLVDQYYSFVGLPLEVPTTLKDLGCYDSNEDWYTSVYSWANYNGDPVPETVTHGVGIYAPVLTETTHINGMRASVTLGAGEVFNLYLPIHDKSVKDGSVYSPEAIGRTAEEVTVDGRRALKLSFAFDICELASKTVTVCFTTRAGSALEYKLDIGLLDYAEKVAKGGECGSDGSRLIRELVGYKKAIAGYLGVTFTESENEALTAFYAAFDAHGTDCTCGAGFDGGAPEQRPLSVYTDAGVSGLSFALSVDSAALRIDVSAGSLVKSVSYTDITGKAVAHNAQSGTLKRTDADTGAYYTVDGITFRDAVSTLKITVNNGTADTVIEYSLGQYISSSTGGTGSNSSVCDALYSYAAALGKYKR